MELPFPRNPSRAERSFRVSRGAKCNNERVYRNEGRNKAKLSFAARRIIAAVAAAAVEKRNMQSGNLTATGAPELLPLLAAFSGLAARSAALRFATSLPETTPSTPSTLVALGKARRRDSSSP